MSFQSSYNEHIYKYLGNLMWSSFNAKFLILTFQQSAREPATVPLQEDQTDCRVLWRQALPCKMRIRLRETQVNQQSKMKETKYTQPLHDHRIEATPTTLQQTSSRLDVMHSTAPGGPSRDQRRLCRSTPIFCRIDICIVLLAADDGFWSYPILSPALASLPACPP